MALPVDLAAATPAGFVAFQWSARDGWRRVHLIHRRFSYLNREPLNQIRLLGQSDLRNNAIDKPILVDLLALEMRQNCK